MPRTASSEEHRLQLATNHRCMKSSIDNLKTQPRHGLGSCVHRRGVGSSWRVAGNEHETSDPGDVGAGPNLNGVGTAAHTAFAYEWCILSRRRKNLHLFIDRTQQYSVRSGIVSFTRIKSDSAALCRSRACTSPQTAPRRAKRQAHSDLRRGRSLSGTEWSGRCPNCISHRLAGLLGRSSSYEGSVSWQD